MADVPHQPGFCLLQSLRGRRRAHSTPVVKPEVQPVEKQEPEDPQVSGEPVLEVTGSTRASQGRRQGWQGGWQVAGETLPRPERSSGLPATSPAVLLYGVRGPSLPGRQPSALQSPWRLLCQSRLLQSNRGTCSRNLPSHSCLYS